MAKLVTYRCPDCKGEFDFLHHPSDEPPPDRCELCNMWMGDEPERVPVLHLRLATEKNRVPDQVYRRMESASAARAEEAASIVGASASEMGAVKITNMKDNGREGDVSAMTVTVSEAQKRLSTAVAAPVYQNPQASQWAGETTSGPAALTTRRVMESMPHGELIARQTRAGNDGKRY